MSGELIAIVLGLGVGLSLGALGGGGSTLAVPILVFVAGLEARDATTASLLVVGVASVFGVVGHVRHGNVRLGVGLAFGVTGLAGSRIGLLLNRSVDERMLLLGFSLLITFVAIRMYRKAGSVVVDEPSGDVDVDALETGSGVLLDARVAKKASFDVSVAAVAKLAAAATGVGLLTGLFGVGGGFAVVPALTLLLGFPAKKAIGTSLVVIAVNAAMALLMRSGDLGFDWSVVGPFLATVTTGVVIGTRVAARVDAGRLTRSFSVMLGAVAAYTAVSTLVSA